MADTPIGQTWLRERYELRCPPPSVVSTVGPGTRRTIIEANRTIEKYAPVYAPGDTMVDHLRFALRHEPLSTAILAGTFAACDREEVAAWVRSEPNGAYARRAWFLFEWFTGTRLDVPDAGAVGYVTALDPSMNLATAGTRSQRHKVVDNLPGVPGFCPSVRMTDALRSYQADNIDDRAREIVSDCDPQILARAGNYLYTKETKSTFEIERETASGQRAERFVRALRDAGSFDATDPASMIDLQNVIVDPRYAAKGFRDFQNFVGESAAGYREIVHFVCPKPEDLPDLMGRWVELSRKLKGTTDPVAAAAILSFAFVFLHPFEDGNGRIHRFLIHQVLSSEGFTPPDVLFPVSAAIVRDRRGYEAALESFSRSIAPFVEWKWTPKKEIAVTNDTVDLYRYFDATPLVEFLYAKVKDTVEKDLQEELEFVAVYDAAYRAAIDVVDMPDRRASLFVTLCLQNGGTLSNRKRAQFPELDDADVANMEEAIRAAMEEAGDTDDPDHHEPKAVRSPSFRP